MANIQVKLRRGTDTEHSSFTGAEGEVTVDTTNDTLRVHDGYNCWWYSFSKA